MLEEELKAVWGLDERYSLGSTDMAHNEYAICNGLPSDHSFFRTVADKGYRSHLQQLCEATATIVRTHLLEALSSPVPYIREWAKLIVKEQQDAGR